ncbi:hypothetical protein [Paracoccus alkanivorans]|uniref:Calcium-binding protein n=1 Tax=Paracoccus alkanivorans TaxID=2116655 RepID=A0A3M0MM24_9RHOB|nr:hypothetical protein [Paracoccus alkanivorans]RMC37354.1 hypothetical protein C9E81_00945 [Paracoccus alkanivorans]
MNDPFLIGFGLLALAIGGATIFGNSDDDDDDGNPPSPPPSADEGTEGDDEITSYDAEQDPDGVLSTLGGDDLIRFDEDSDFEADIDAGDGNDTIDMGIADGNQVHGGAGDDDIALEDGTAAVIHGDAGDDTLTVADDDYFDTGGLSLSGGEGDDILRVGMIDALTQMESEHGDAGPTLSGGEGSDGFDLSIELDEGMREFVDSGEDELPRENPIGVITDFVSGEDRLTVDPVTYAEGVNYLGHEIIQSEDGRSTGIQFHYGPEGATTPALHSTLWLEGTPTIAEGDLELLNIPGSVSEGDDLIDSDISVERGINDEGILATLGGNDTISLEYSSSLDEIDLGDGDDSIDGGPEALGLILNSGSVDAGSGNDDINLGGANGTAVSGGEGADTITLTNASAANDGVSLDGGSGDDVIAVTYADNPPGFDTYETNASNSRLLTGGEGQDDFMLAPAMTAAMFEYDIGGQMAEITDFRSGEDQLVIDTESYANGAEYLGHEFIPLDDGNSTEVILRFADPTGSGTEASVSVRVNGPISDADLVIAPASSI